MINKIKETAAYLKSNISEVPEILVVLGSGLGDFATGVENAKVFNYEDIPNFHKPTVEGHDGKLFLGRMSGKKVVVMSGRFHFYEGHDLNEVVFPLRALGYLGIKKVILTNASGGVNKDFVPGDLVVVTDQINLTGNNVLIGPNIKELGPRFPDMTEAYNKKMNEQIIFAGNRIGVKVKTGVYCGFLGPNYETPAEIRMSALLGGDLVGMSTVQEVIAANHM